MSKAKKAVIFDLDGTVVDSMPMGIKAFLHAIEPFRSLPSTADLLAALGGAPDHCLGNLLGPDGVAHIPEASKRFFAFQAEGLAHVLLFDGVAELLDFLRNNKISLGLFTGRDRCTTERILDRCGLQSYLQAIVCGDDGHRAKPDPAGLLVTLQRLGVDPDEALFVGDTVQDALAGQSAGVETVLIWDGSPLPAAVLSGGVNVFQSPTEAYRAIQAIVAFHGLDSVAEP